MAATFVLVCSALFAFFVTCVSEGMDFGAKSSGGNVNGVLSVDIVDVVLCV
jgi:hypothetical protein